jgi:hypothetical protein
VVCHDHVEAASYLALAAATGGEIRVEGTDLHAYWMTRRVFGTLGVKIELHKDHVYLPGNQELRVARDHDGSIPVIGDGPWPQFATDQMSCMITLATQVTGNVLFFEKMFESRLYFVDRLIAMGANAVVCDPHRVLISGPSKLTATTLTSPDIRAGMALLGAALCANGKSTVQNANMIERGYGRIVMVSSVSGPVVSFPGGGAYGAAAFTTLQGGSGGGSGGYGLGLAIVRHVLQKHGGELKIESVEGRGTTFSCHFAPLRLVRESVAKATDSRYSAEQDLEN